MSSAWHRWRLASLLAISLAFPWVARAGWLLQFPEPHAQAGQTIELQGLLPNDSGDFLTTQPPRSLQGHWTDAQGRRMPAQFTLRSTPDAITLPAHAFTRAVWSTQVPARAQGLLTLQLEEAEPVLLALHVQPEGASRALASASSSAVIGQATDASESDAVTLQGLEQPEAGHPASEEGGLSPFETFRNALSPYEPVYFAVGNRGGANARFQISFKYRPFSPRDAANPNFMNHWYLGYTQTSLWDLHSDSIPFVDTTYNPSLFWARDSLWQAADQRWFVGLNAGFEHASNGKDGDRSRSMNDLYLQPELNWRPTPDSTLTFSPRFKYYVNTDRDMDYPGYFGHVDWKLRWAQDNGLAVSALYRRGSDGRHATQLELAWPLQRTFLRMNGYLYAQLFSGYGETLLHYRERQSPQLRVGLAIVP